MNILLINDFLEGGGAEAVFRYQYEVLKKDFNVDMFYGFKYISDRKASPFSYIYSSHFKQELKSFLNNRGFDYIIIHNYNGALSPSVLDTLSEYKKETNCKVIHYAHDFHLVCPNRGYSYFKNGQTRNFPSPPALSEFLFKRLDYRSAAHSLLKKLQWILAYTIGKKQKVFDLILTPSDFLGNQIRLLYPESDIKRVYNSCNALGFAKKRQQRSSNVLQLVYFGRLDPVKGLVNFIEALKSSKINYTFTMIGEGDDLDAIQNTIKQAQLQDRIFVKPKMNHSDLFAELPNYDVFVLPALWYENAPLSIIEAASIGLGLFLSIHGGVLEMGQICNASHFFSPFDKKEITQELDILYQDFLSGSLPTADNEHLQSLFSKDIYIQNLKRHLQ